MITWNYPSASQCKQCQSSVWQLRKRTKNTEVAAIGNTVTNTYCSVPSGSHFSQIFIILFQPPGIIIFVPVQMNSWMSLISYNTSAIHILLVKWVHYVSFRIMMPAKHSNDLVCLNNFLLWICSLSRAPLYSNQDPGSPNTDIIQHTPSTPIMLMLPMNNTLIHSVTNLAEV